jgi:hypothetical protein
MATRSTRSTPCEVTQNLIASLRSHYASLWESLEKLNDETIADDTRHFLDLCPAAFRLAGDPEACRKYLQEKGLHTYGDMREMHDRIMTYLELPEDKLNELIMVAGSQPELARGYGRLFFHCWDFMLGIGVIPHPPDPEQPTLLGLYLSATQSILRDQRIFITALSQSDMMHLSLMMGVYNSVLAHTTTGERLYTAYPRPAVEPESYGRLNFENFTITNAIAFHPEQVLLTGYQTLYDPSGTTTYKIPRQVMYNVFTPYKAAFYPSPEFSSLGVNPESLESGSDFTPEFYRQLVRSVTNSVSGFNR